MMIIAVAFFLSAIAVGSFTSNTWRNCGTAWALLLIGTMIFSIVLTL